ncbi:MAG: LytTR family DNA-binding domain-containing protein [Bacteroidota bacterium]
MLKAILNRPFYFEEDDRLRWRVVFLITLFVFFFLSVFQPFQLSTYPKAKLPVFLSYAAITFVVSAFFAIFLPKVFPKWFNSERWTTGKEISYFLSMILFIGLGNTLYSAWMCFFRNFWLGLFYFEIYTFAVALFPILFIVFITEKLENQKHESLSTALMTQKQATQTPIQPRETIQITASNNKTVLTIVPQNIYYLKSEANYIEIIYRDSNKFEKTLLRNTLSAMEQQFQDFDYLFRCHKSYLVNLNQVERISGNAQGLKIHFDGLEEVIPVSRKYNELLKARFQ